MAPTFNSINTRMFTHVGTLTDLLDLRSITSPNGKRVYTTPSGAQYSSITTMLGHKEKPWLKEWQNLLGVDKAAKETKRCADRGTAIHEMAEKYLNNSKTVTVGYQQKHICGFNQLKFKLNQINNIRAQEVALYSDIMKVAGRVDCVGEYNDVLSIIDFKTSNNNKTNDMIYDYFLQCTAYAIMWHELTGESIENITILMSVERSMVPLVFQAKIDKYISPLLQRIDQFYKETK
jgi:hypothetical protein